MSGLLARACPLCGPGASAPFADARAGAGGEFEFSSRKLPDFAHHRLVTCSSCGLVYADPAPAPGALERAYDAAAFDTSEEAAFAARTYAGLLDGLSLPDRDGALDVGAGDGAFLSELLARGFTRVAGVEPSRAPIAAARPELRPLLRHGPFRPGDFGAERFRLVTCFQTLEHLHDPLRFCADALSMLKPGGAFLAVGHDRLALSARLLGRRSPIYDVEHLQLFSPATVVRLLEKAGFTGVRAHPILNRYPLHYWLKLSPLPSALKTALSGRFKRSALGRLPLSVPAGNMAVSGYRP